MTPGSHTVVITPDAPRDGIRARTQGFELRDTLVIFLPGRTLHALLLRKPLAEKTVAAQVLATGTGAINIDGARVGDEVVSTHSRGVNSAFPKRPGETSVEESGRKQDQREGLDHSERRGRWPTNVLLFHGPPVILQRPTTVKKVGH